MACLAEPPSLLLLGDGELRSERLEWAQPLDRWTVLYYQHCNAVTVNAQTYLVEPGAMVFYAPGVKATHARVDEGTNHFFMTCNLPGNDGSRSAIPTHCPHMERVLPDMMRAAYRISDDRRPGIAFAWNLFWSVAQSAAVFRQHEELYAAESWIFQHLSDRFSVRDVAAVVDLSPRHLLRAFREEHRMTVQEYVRQKRVQEATRLLATTRSPVKEVAIKVGIPDLQQFNKLIRQETGASPRQFRRLAEEPE